jgi:predicted nucleotide-binding protein
MTTEQIDATPDGQKKRTRQKRMTPASSLEDSLVVIKSIAEANNGKPYSRLLVAQAMNRKPDSSIFRQLVTSSNQYGLSVGGYSAERIAISDRGMSIAMPKDDSEKTRALRETFHSIDAYNRIYEHYKGAKLPQQDLLRNTLIRELGIPAENASEVMDGFIRDATFVGLVADVSGSLRVLTEAYLEDTQGALETSPASTIEVDSAPDSEPHSVPAPITSPLLPNGSSDAKPAGPTRIFITHGSNSGIVEQIRQILLFGKYQPVIAEEQQTTAISVPDKVLNSMRTCQGGIIHVENERVLLDDQGETHYVLNPNVLIEIGAAMALYKRKFVLLVKRGVKLPSNLQGLYRCDYEGDKLDFDATMKLLQVFNEFDGDVASLD